MSKRRSNGGKEARQQSGVNEENPNRAARRAIAVKAKIMKKGRGQRNLEMQRARYGRDEK